MERLIAAMGGETPSHNPVPSKYVTAEQMERLIEAADPGYSVETETTEEVVAEEQTLTTSRVPGQSNGQARITVIYQGDVPETLKVIYDRQEYTLPADHSSSSRTVYGNLDTNGFEIGASGGWWTLYTQGAGAHTIAMSALTETENIVVSEKFKAAVHACGSTDYSVEEEKAYLVEPDAVDLHNTLPPMTDFPDTVFISIGDDEYELFADGKNKYTSYNGEVTITAWEETTEINAPEGLEGTICSIYTKETSIAVSDNFKAAVGVVMAPLLVTLTPNNVNNPLAGGTHDASAEELEAAWNAGRKIRVTLDGESIFEVTNKNNVAYVGDFVYYASSTFLLANAVIFKNGSYSSNLFALNPVN